ncbi:Ig-like domain-containing protein [Vibrio coralliirubri]|uniref:Ig-like domain-containing protein n=1 Tax=Vibrio coralliirubri TaxID=1516159 RepID=UPI00076A318B|nr:Ig-like domain-containing protein [Vibrio coralliirubri]
MKIKAPWLIALAFISLITLSGCHDVSELVVTPKHTSIPAGLELQLKAEKIFLKGAVIDVTNNSKIKWKSSDTSIATVDNNGLVSSKKTAGSVVISAVGFFNGKTFTDSVTIDITDSIITSISVIPEIDSIPVGLTSSFKAIASFSNGDIIDITDDASVIWASSDENIALISNDISNKGVTEAKSIGSSTITASIDLEGKLSSGSAILNVSKSIPVSIDISPDGHRIPVGLDETFSATIQMSDGQEFDITNNASITWSTSDSEIATISNDVDSKGTVTGVNNGSVNIIASALLNDVYVYGLARLDVTKAVITSLEINPKYQSGPVGIKKAFSVFAHLSDGSVVDATSDKAISWSSSNTDVATISNSLLDKGTATGVSVGDTTITAFFEVENYEVTSTAKLNISEAIPIGVVVTPKPQPSLDTPQITVGAQKQFKVEMVMSDNGRIDVTREDNVFWEIGDMSIANLSNTKGLVSGVNVGVTSVKVRLQSNDYNFEDSTELTVTLPHSITLSIITGKYTNEVNDINIEYLGYSNGVMGYDSIISGEEFLASPIDSVYVARVVSGSNGYAKFFFGRFTDEMISGSLSYQATFSWPDGSTTEGRLDWDFYSRHYHLRDLSAIQHLINNNWDFTITVSNEK